jgi:hypothetical protein
MAIVIAKIATDEDIKKIKESKVSVYVLKAEDYLYKGEPLNIKIKVSLENIEEGHFFDIDDTGIIELDRISRCFNTYIRGIDPRCEYYSDNDELKEKLKTLTNNFKGTLHNQLVQNLYIITIKYCRFWTRFMGNLSTLLMINDGLYPVQKVMIDVNDTYYKYARYLVHFKLDE